MKEFNLTEYLKDPSKKVVTRDGRDVRIICTDCKDEFKIVALVYNKKQQKESVECFYENGKYLFDIDNHHLDLFFAPIKKEGWINIYKNNSRRDRIAGDVFPSEKEAKEGKTIGYITTIKIEWEE